MPTSLPPTLMDTPTTRREQTFAAAAIATALAAMAYVEYTHFGSRLVPLGEPLKLWHPGWGSQHLADAYSITHLAHGLLMFFIHKNLLSRYVRPVQSVLLGAAVEITWELWEASPGAKASYGEVYDYKGDTVVNSVFDVLFMVTALVLALRWIETNAAGVAVWVAIDAVSLALIADTFLLNHLWAMLPRATLHHYFGPIARWQERRWEELGE